MTYVCDALLTSQSLSPDLKRKVDAQRRAHKEAEQNAAMAEQQQMVRLPPTYPARSPAGHRAGALGQVA